MTPLHAEVPRWEMTPLYAEVHRWEKLPFVWGETDCCLVCCDWVAQVTGIDPAADVRMTYSSPGECQRVTGYLRDPLGVTTRLMEDGAGLPRTDNPAPGDVAVIKLMYEGWVSAIGALRLGPEGWAVKAPRGTTTVGSVVVLGVMRAWSVGYAP